MVLTTFMAFIIYRLVNRFFKVKRISYITGTTTSVNKVDEIKNHQ